MEELFRVYTIKMARYLTLKGFKYVKTVQDIKKPQFLNWYFEKTPELLAAVDEFTQKYYG